MSDMLGGVATQIGVQPPLPSGYRAPSPGGVPSGTSGAGQVITKAQADAENARLRAAGYTGMPVMPTDFVFGKGLAPPPGAGSVGSQPATPGVGGYQGPGTATGDAARTSAWQASSRTAPGGFQPITGELNDYVQRTMRLEGSGKDPRSSAVGGFIDSTWLSLLKKHFPQQTQGMNEQQILELRHDPHAREQATAAYAADNAGILSAAGQPVTPVTMRMAHFLGPQGAVQLLSAPPDTPISQLVAKKAIDANPGILAGNTAGGVKAAIEAQMSGTNPSLLQLRETAFGGFSGSAVPVIQNLQAEFARRGKAYDEALAESKDIRSAARAAVGRWAAESDKPPQNMHEAWQQWSGIASAFALLGGLVGRNHTAALAAAGTMLQAANSADAASYDKAYQQWKDHLDRGLKLVDLLYQDAHNTVTDARKSYEDVTTELSTLSAFYQLHEKLDPRSVENIGKNLDIARKQKDLIEGQNEQTEIRNAVTAKDQAWLQGHPEAKGAVPPEIHNQHTGDAERERKGTTVSGQVMQFKMSQAAELEAQGVPHEEALRRVGLIPQLPKQAAGSEEAKFVESQVSTDRAAKQSKGEPYTADDEQASRLKAREDWATAAATGRVKAGRPETSSDRVLQWKMNRAKELIDEGKSPDEAYRTVGLEPQQRAAGLENQFVQGSVAQAEAEAAAQARPFTQDDRNAAIGAAAQEWERRKATGRVQAGRAVSATDQLKIDAYQGLLGGQKEQYRNAHDGKDPDGPELTKMQTSALRDAGIIRASAMTGDLGPDTVKMLAQLYTLGDTGVITSLPRTGPGRIQVENEVAKQLEETGRGAGDIALNRLKMAEARAAATTAGRVTIQTELYSQEAEGAGLEVVRTSKLFPRTNYPTINQALEAFALQTGDPNIVQFGQALSAFINAYGKLSNPTGIGVHDADKARIQRNLQEKLSQGQVEAGVEQVITEGRIVSNAARAAQIKVLAGLVPRIEGAAPPAAPPPAAGGSATVAPAIPGGLQGKPGLQWSPSRSQWRDGAGQVYDANGQPVSK